MPRPECEIIARDRRIVEGGGLAPLVSAHFSDHTKALYHKTNSRNTGGMFNFHFFIGNNNNLAVEREQEQARLVVSNKGH